MSIDNMKKWEDFLQPDLFRSNLIVSSLYISAFEILKDCIIGRLRDFFIIGFDENGIIINKKRYNETVLRKNKSPLFASLTWLLEHDVITKDDIIDFENIRDYRNKLAHEMVTIIFEGMYDEISDLFEKMISLLDRIEKWWIINVEIPTDPDITYNSFDQQNIIPGPIMTLNLMLDIALGEEEKAKEYLEIFKSQIVK